MTTLNGKSVNELFQEDSFKKSLKDAEHVVQYVNKHYISLNDADYTLYAEHLKTVLTKLVLLMKENDDLFKTLYQKEHFAGSYPDGLKIGKPTEYDMNLIIRLPVDLSLLKFVDEAATPSFLMINGKEAFKNASTPNGILGWTDEEGYLLQTKVRDWMESVLTKALNTLPLTPESDQGNTRCLKIGEQNGEEQVYKIGHKKSGPAMTLKVLTPDNCSLDVDLVPAFVFGPPLWPKSVIPLPKSCSKKKSWMVVPKPKKIKEGDKPEPNDAREWRMSFLDQEREILNGSGTVKPTIKLLKKLRDATNIKLSSYAIKTVVMLEMKDMKPEFWKNRVVYIFFYMLNRLLERIATGRIPFYWDERDDLLKLEKVTYENISNRLTKLLKDMLKAVENDPFIIAEKLLKKDELADVRHKCPILSANVQTTPRNIESKGSKAAEAPCEIMQNGSNDKILSKILSKLEQIHEGQEKLSINILNHGSTEKDSEDTVDCRETKLDHVKCHEKQCQLEERIAKLEDLVYVMKRQLDQINPERNFSVLQ